MWERVSLVAQSQAVVRIAEIEAGSIADELSLEIGSRVVRINGERVRDGIDLTFLLSDGCIELETLSPAGETIVHEFDREPLKSHRGLARNLYVNMRRRSIPGKLRGILLRHRFGSFRELYGPLSCRGAEAIGCRPGRAGGGAQRQ